MNSMNNNDRLRNNRLFNIYTANVAGIIFVFFNIIIFVIETLILLKLLPYTIIGGGNFESYNSALPVIILSTILLLFEIIFVIIVLKYYINNKYSIFINIILWIIFLLLVINLIGNILSKTLFEKIFMGIICLFQIINIIRIQLKINYYKE